MCAEPFWLRFFFATTLYVGFQGWEEGGGREGEPRQRTNAQNENKTIKGQSFGGVIGLRQGFTIVKKIKQASFLEPLEYYQVLITKTTSHVLLLNSGNPKGSLFT